MFVIVVHSPPDSMGRQLFCAHWPCTAAQGEAMPTDTRVPNRIQRKRSRGWRLPEGAVIVDRSTVWGNPFIPGKPCMYLPGHLVQDKRHAGRRKGSASSTRASPLQRTEVSARSKKQKVLTD